MARPYARSVFLNVPFDGTYRPLFHALTFAVIDCGYVARCGLEVEDASQIRLEKIYQLIAECRYGIHDISRTEPSKVTGLPRFNMPLELGVFLGAKRFGAGAQRHKSCLILDRERYRYQRFCSDIAGQDVAAHNGKPADAVYRVRDWLAATSETRIPGGQTMASRFMAFRQQMPKQCRAFQLEPAELIFRDYVTLATAWLLENPW